MDQWITEELTRVLKTDICDELTRHILSIETLVDYDDFMHSLLELSKEDHKEVYENIKSVKFGLGTFSPEKQVDKSINKILMSANTSYSCNNSDNRGKHDVNTSNQSVASDVKPKVKTTKKFVKYHIQQLQNGMLREGRIHCDCNAQVHNLINNCLSCGRVICAQEGSGPCFFCGQVVCTQEEMQMINSNTKHGEQLLRTLKDRKFKEAIELRDRLLDYDKNSAQRTKVIDDEHDYFDMNSQWLSKEEKAKRLKAMDSYYNKKHASKLAARKITLDFADKKAIEVNDFVDEEVNFSDEEKNNDPSTVASKEMEEFINKMTNLLLTNDKQNGEKPKIRSEIKNVDTGDKNRFIYTNQSADLMLHVDKSACLSMHQPWASLLVSGIKKHEGRNWYSEHRGLLWIHAASKKPSKEEIKSVQDFYIDFYGDRNLKFPESYPTSALVGCVVVENVLDDEEYREQYPNGESSSPFVFICGDPRKLLFPLPMEGKHKIYKLDRKVHSVARDAINFVKKQCRD